MQALHERLAVQPEDLRRRLDAATLPFQTTAEVAPVKTTIGQPRAAEAIAFALEVGARGFHLYAGGPPGTGRESTVLAAVRSSPRRVRRRRTGSTSTTSPSRTVHALSRCRPVRVGSWQRR